MREGCNTVVVVFLMRIKCKISVFIKYNECQGLCLVSTDARTYRQLCTTASWTTICAFILIQGEGDTVITTCT